MATDIETKINNKPEEKNEETKVKPVNTRTLHEEQHENELPGFDAKAFADENKTSMGAETHAKFEAFLKANKLIEGTFGLNENDSMIAFASEDMRSLQLGVFAGSMPVPMENGMNNYVPSLYLPASVFVGRSDKKKKNGFQLGMRQAVALAAFLPKFLEANRPAVEYLVALEKEIEMRKAAGEDYGF